jgi:hypothetical protein
MLSDVSSLYMTLIFIEIIAALILPLILALAQMDRWFSSRKHKAIVSRRSISPVQP